MAEALTLDKPRSPRRPAARRSNFELYSWLFMRISGLLLVVLVLGHLFIMNIPTAVCTDQLRVRRRPVLRLAVLGPDDALAGDDPRR